MEVIKPPTDFRGKINNRSLFIAGSIEMDTATNWQSVVEDRFRNYQITILNPRRDHWDPTWEQTIDDEQFRYQVTWELDALEIADDILIYFEPNTKSPVSLLELGLFAERKPYVVCPKGFWRRGNVEIVCKRFSIPLYETLDNPIIEIQDEFCDGGG